MTAQLKFTFGGLKVDTEGTPNTNDAPIRGLRRRRDHGPLPQESTGNVGVAGEYLRTHRRHERRRITLGIGCGNPIEPVSLIASGAGRYSAPAPKIWYFTQPFPAIPLDADQEERRGR